MLESYVTPVITSYLSKYIKNIKPSDLQLSFWGGDVVLRNLELSPEAIEDSLKGLVPFNLKSGCVKTLTIHIPWTAIGSEAITLSLDNVECSVKLKNLKTPETITKDKDSKATPTTTPVVDQSKQTPGYIQGLMNRIVNNIVICVQNLVVNVIEEESDLLMSFTVRSLKWCATNDHWTPEYVYSDSFIDNYALYKMCTVTDMTVCLDRIGSAGQVDVYETPFVPRCSFECHWKSCYENGSLAENLIDLRIQELLFSVTEVQFSLFLHLIDWLIAMYYSYKKLKGRDNREEQALEPISPKLSPPPHASSEDLTTATTHLSPTPEDQQGWSSWLLSFVDTDPDDMNSTASKPAVKPVSVPNLSLNLIADCIMINLKMNLKMRNPIFFTSHTNISSQVVKICFKGCLAHVSRVPTTTLLGVSVGIMSVNAWIGGLCPCTTKPKHINNTLGNFEESQVRVYSLGRESISDVSEILQNTFFKELVAEGSTNTEAVPKASVTPQEWLQPRECYRAVWFSYEYYDKGLTIEREECKENVIIGEQCFIVTPDVVHRIRFFVEHFLNSLDAVPLISQGMVVIGDPLAKTDLHIISNGMKLLLTVNCHIIPTDSNQLNSPSSRKEHQSVLDSLVLSYHSLDVCVCMPMYSGNDTPTCHQELCCKVSCEQLRIFSHRWSVSNVTCFSRLQKSKTGFTFTNLKLDFSKKTKGVAGMNENCCLVQASRCLLDVNHNELLVYCMMYCSWIQSSLLQKLELNPVPKNLQSGVLSIEMFSSCFKLDFLPTSRKYCFSFHKLEVSFTPANLDLTLPILHCTMDASNLVHCKGLELWEDNLSSPSGDDLALQAQLALEDSCDLFVELKMVGIILFLEPSLLCFIKSSLCDVVKMSSTTCQQKDIVPTAVDQEGSFPVANRPDPEGLSSSDLYSPMTMTSGVPPLPYILDIGDNDEQEPLEQQEGLLPIFNRIRFSINTNHAVIVSVTSDWSLLDHAAALRDLHNPVQVIRRVMKTERLVFLVLPVLNVHTSDSHLYPLLVTKLPGAPSWQASLTNGTAYVVGKGERSSYLLHPLGLEVSVAPVKTSSSVSGYGVHVDIHHLHFSISKEKLLLFKEVLTKVVDVSSPLIKSTKSQTTAANVTKPFSQPLSVLSSPHLSIYSPIIPLTASETSFSIHSITEPQPSLWLQCTLTKLTVVLAIDKLGRDNTITTEEYYEFKYESDDISFSLDKREKRVNCQLKVSSLEGLTLKDSSHGSSLIHEKMFSSRCTILNPTVLQKVESFNRVTTEERPSYSALSHGSFIVLDINHHPEPHKPLDVRLNVRMFEGVISVPLTRGLLDILVNVFSLNGKEGGKEGDMDDITDNWPLLDISFHSFRLLFPSLSLSTGILVDVGGVTVKSELSYPLERMEVNAAAFRKLSIMVAEKRVPPLPGYEMQLFVLQLIGLNVHDVERGCGSSVAAFPILVIANTQMQYSPSLRLNLLSGTLRREKVYATGDMIEVCFKSDIELSLGLSQVMCVLKLVSDFSTLLRTFKSNHHVDGELLVQQCSPYYVLVTAQSLHMQCVQGSVLPLQITVFDPVITMKSLATILTVQVSIHKLKCVYQSDRSYYLPLVEFVSSCTEHPDRPSLFVQIEQRKAKNEKSYSVVVEVNRNMLVVLSPELFVLFHTYLTDWFVTISPVLTVSRPSHVTKSHITASQLSSIKHTTQRIEATAVDATVHGNESAAVETITTHNIKKVEEILDNLHLNIKTRRITVQMNVTDLSYSQDCKTSCFDCVAISCNELWVNLPSFPDAHGNDTGFISPNILSSLPLKASVTFNSLEVKYHTHVTTCAKHVASYLLLPTNLNCCVTRYSQSESSIECPNISLFLSVDPVHLSAGLCTVDLFRSLYLSYSVPLERISDLLKSHNRSSLEKNEAFLKAANDEKIVFCDDLRRGGMTFSTLDIDSSVLPMPGEVRFFDGNMQYPPHMVWQYLEPRHVTRVEVLPIPLGVFAHEGTPKNLRVRCELAYLEETSSVLVPVGTLHISETSTSLWTDCSVTDEHSNDSVPEEMVHARVWCLTIKGLDWSEDDEEFSSEFPVPDFIASSILSPLMLAGCATVNSEVHYEHLPLIEIEARVKRFEISLLYQPQISSVAQRFEGYKVHNDLSWNRLSLIQLQAKDFTTEWRMKANRHQLAKVKSSISVFVQDLRDLTVREVARLTDLTAKLTVKQGDDIQGVSLNISMEPCLIRISPTLIHTVAIAMHILLDSSDKERRERPSSLLFAAHIICNRTNTGLYIGQVGTAESLALPEGACVGYHWNTHICEQWKLRLAVTSNEWVWSSPFLLDSEGVQEIVVTQSDGKHVLLYVEVIRMGGAQTKVIISGLWTITSRLPHTLFVGIVHNGSQQADNLISLEQDTKMSLLMCEDDILRIMGGCVGSRDWHDLTIRALEQPQPFPLKVSNENEHISHVWCTVVPQNKSTLRPIKVVIAPVFEFVNNLPQDVTLTISWEASTHVVSLCGRGKRTTPPCSFLYDSSYLVSISDSALKGVATSSSFPLSALIANQLPPVDDGECGVWPYNECINHRSAKGSSIQISVPVDEDCWATVNVDLQRDGKCGIILVTLSPALLLVNNTGMNLVILMGGGFQREIGVDGGDATPLLNINEEFQIKILVNNSQCALLSPPQSIDGAMDNKKGSFKKIKLYNGQIGCEIIMDISLHRHSLMVTLKPSHVITNNTAHLLYILPELQNVTQSDNIQMLDTSDTNTLSLSPSDSKPIANWTICHESERLAYVIRVSTTDSQLVDVHSKWSLPILLNFVRRSFSLSLYDTNAVTTPTYVPCILTTHKMEGVTYVVIDTDPSPRLLVHNLCPMILKIREAHSHPFHAHSQGVCPNSQVVFEPPTLAMQYPLIKEWAESESEDVQRVQFKQLSDIPFQIGRQSHDSHVTCWSGPFKINVTNCIEDVVIPQLAETLNIITKIVNRTTTVTIVPKEQSHKTTFNDRMIDSPLLFSLDLLLQQLIIALDVETTDHIQPVLISSFDNVHAKVLQSVCENKIDVVIESLQIDASFDQPLQVVLCPRASHDPPTTLLKSHPPPFVCFSIALSRDFLFSDVYISLQPVTLQINDVLIIKLIDALINFRPPDALNNLLRLSHAHSSAQLVPLEVIAEAQRDKLPVMLQKLRIPPISIYLTAHTSKFVTLSCDDSALQFSGILLTESYTNTAELSQLLSMHYTTGLVMQLGWVLGSLDILGNPSLLLHRLQTGLHNFVYLPYEGLTRGPGFFMLGVGRGVSSLLANVSGGMLRIVTNFSSSVASNMERFSLDSDHISYQQALRQSRSQSTRGIGAGVSGGMSSFGMSLMSAVAGVVDQPMQTIQQSQSGDIGSYTQQMIMGVGKGLLGLVTKPVGGAFQLVSQTGQGLLNTSGLVCTPSVKNNGSLIDSRRLLRTELSSSVDKYMRIILLQYNEEMNLENIYGNVICYAFGTIQLPSGSVYKCFALLSHEKIFVLDTEKNIILTCFDKVDCHQDTPLEMDTEEIHDCANITSSSYRSSESTEQNYVIHLTLSRHLNRTDIGSYHTSGDRHLHSSASDIVNEDKTIETQWQEKYVLTISADCGKLFECLMFDFLEA